MAGLIPQDFIDDLIARADIVEVVGRRVQLKKAGVALLELEPGVPQLEPGSGQLKLLLTPKVLLEGKK